MLFKCNKFGINLAIILLTLFIVYPCNPVKSQDMGSFVKHGINGSNLIYNERYSEAIPELKAALEIMPDQPDLLYKLGRAYSGISDEKTAITYYKKALVLNSNHADAHYNLGISLRDTGNINEAIKEFNTGLIVVDKMKGEPDFNIKSYKLDCLWCLADIYASLGNNTETINYLNQILKIDPKDKQAKYNLNILNSY